MRKRTAKPPSQSSTVFVGTSVGILINVQYKHLKYMIHIRRVVSAGSTKINKLASLRHSPINTNASGAVGGL